MLKNVTRWQIIEAWFGTITLAAAAAIAFGAMPTLATAVGLAALSLVPPGVVLIVWPGVQPPTAADVLRGDRY